MNEELLVIDYGITIVASAVAGGYLPAVIRMTHVRMQMILSFVGGLMLGVAILHLLPHSLQMVAEELPNYREAVMRALLIGLLFTFFMMRAFHFHQHGEDTSEGDHDHGHPHGHDERRRRTKLSWLGVIFGLSLHTFIDGIALGTAIMADHGGTPWSPLGFSVYLAILLHKPLDALSLASLMHVQGWSHRTIQAANACFALTCPVGALIVVMSSRFDMLGFLAGGATLGLLLAAAAGVFLCIALSDLLPEVQFHRHDRVQLSAALLSGIAIAYGMELHTTCTRRRVPRSRDTFWSFTRGVIPRTE